MFIERKVDAICVAKSTPSFGRDREYSKLLGRTVPKSTVTHCIQRIAQRGQRRSQRVAPVGLACCTHGWRTGRGNVLTGEDRLRGYEPRDDLTAPYARFELVSVVTDSSERCTAEVDRFDLSRVSRLVSYLVLSAALLRRHSSASAAADEDSPAGERCRARLGSTRLHRPARRIGRKSHTSCRLAAESSHRSISPGSPVNSAKMRRCSRFGKHPRRTVVEALSPNRRTATRYSKVAFGGRLAPYGLRARTST